MSTQAGKGQMQNGLLVNRSASMIEPSGGNTEAEIAQARSTRRWLTSA